MNRTRRTQRVEHNKVNTSSLCSKVNFVHLVPASKHKHQTRSTSLSKISKAGKITALPLIKHNYALIK